MEHAACSVALVNVGNPEKKKVLYAFGTGPMKPTAVAELVRQPLDAPENLYSGSGKQAAVGEQISALRKNQPVSLFDLNEKQVRKCHPQGITSLLQDVVGFAVPAVRWKAFGGHHWHTLLPHPGQRRLL